MKVANQENPHNSDMTGGSSSSGGNKNKNKNKSSSNSNSSASPGANRKHLGEKEGFLYTAGPALASGAVQSVLFNPIDRALYVRVKHRRRRFLDPRNFDQPFQGLTNAAVYRTLVGASYIFWQDTAQLCIPLFFPSFCQKEVNPHINSFLIGLLAGSVNGIALNSLQAVKFRMWNNEGTSDTPVGGSSASSTGKIPMNPHPAAHPPPGHHNSTFFRTAKLMYIEGGIPIFFRGCVTTIMRDSVFGVVYETTRRTQQWIEFFDHHVIALQELEWEGYRYWKTKLFSSSSSAASDSSSHGGDNHTPNSVMESGVKETPASSSSSSSSTIAVAGGGGGGGQREGCRRPAASGSPGDKRAINNNDQCETCIFLSNLFAAMIASMLSSPFNYVRSTVYGTPAGAVPLGYGTLLRSFYTQYYYVWRHGMSFVEREGFQGNPKPQPQPQPQPPHGTSTNGHKGSSSSSARALGGKKPQQQLIFPELYEAEHTVSYYTRGPQESGRRSSLLSHAAETEARPRTLWERLHSRCGRVERAVRHFCDTHGHHPVASWRWANSRLNIGWGSLRVGLGMALGQSLFHLAQNYARSKN